MFLLENTGFRPRQGRERAHADAILGVRLETAEAPCEMGIPMVLMVQVVSKPLRKHTFMVETGQKR